MRWGVKNIKNFDLLMSKLKGTVSVRFILYLVHELVGIM